MIDFATVASSLDSKNWFAKEIHILSRLGTYVMQMGLRCLH